MIDEVIQPLPPEGAFLGFRPFAPPFCSTVDVCTAYRSYLFFAEEGDAPHPGEVPSQDE